MADTLLLYKDGTVIKQQPKAESGATKVKITGLKSNTEYPKGTFQLAWKGVEKESDKVDVPAFTTDKKAVKSINVSNSELTLEVGETQTISYDVAPSDADEKGVTFTSNNSPVATVNAQGVVEAVKGGNATITVKSKDNTKVTSKVSITVNEPVVEEPNEKPTEEPSEEPNEDTSEGNREEPSEDEEQPTE